VLGGNSLLRGFANKDGRPCSAKGTKIRRAARASNQTPTRNEIWAKKKNPEKSQLDELGRAWKKAGRKGALGYKDVV